LIKNGSKDVIKHWWSLNRYSEYAL